MRNDKALSIIVPFYNVEDYIGDCLDSLLQTTGIEQTEIILVDDGSTDRTGEIAASYSRQYEFMKYHHINNSGPATARNYGIKKAEGPYIFFCDSDDKVVAENFASVIDLVKTINVDMITWNAGRITKEGYSSDERNKDYFDHVGLNESDGILTGRQIVEKQLRCRGDYPATIWLGAYRRDFLLKNDLFFEDGLLHEDELWSHQVLLKAETVQYINKKVYLYRNRPGSVMNPINEDMTKRIESVIYVYTALYKLCDEEMKDDPVKKLYEANLTRRYMYMIYLYRFYRNGYGNRIDIKLLWEKNDSIKYKIKLLLLIAHGRLSCLFGGIDLGSSKCR